MSTYSKPQNVDDTSSASKDRLRLWLRLLTVSRRIETQLRDNFRTEFETTLPRFDVLAALDRHSDGLKMSELSVVLRVSNGNITGIIDRLVEDGHAKRLAVPGDRRASRVCLTRAGKTQFQYLAQAHEKWLDDLLSGFSSQEASEMSQRLKMLQDQISKTVELNL